MTRKRATDTRKGRSGTKWTEADYDARGYVRISLRLTPHDAQRLDSLRVDGETQAGAIRRLIREAWEATK